MIFDMFHVICDMFHVISGNQTLGFFEHLSARLDVVWILGIEADRLVGMPNHSHCRRKIDFEFSP